MSGLEAALRGARDRGRTVLMPFVTGGIAADWTDLLLAYEAAGADAIEVGLPFSDPMLDGVTIQQASDRALARGTTVDSVLADVAAVRLGIPLVLSTYLNLVVHDGATRFCRRVAEAGIAGLIVPDLPVDEAAELEAAAAAADVDLVLLVAPATAPERLAEICARSRGFVYAVSVMGTTGERSTLADSAGRLAARVRAVSDRPVVIGFGISGPAQAVAAGRAGDGAVVGAALMRRVLDGATPAEVGHEVARLRAALEKFNREEPAGTAYAEVSGDRG